MKSEGILGSVGMFKLRMTPFVANGAMWTTLTPARMPENQGRERLTSGPARRAEIGRELQMQQL